MQLIEFLVRGARAGFNGITKPLPFVWKERLVIRILSSRLLVKIIQQGYPRREVMTNDCFEESGSIDDGIDSTPLLIVGDFFAETPAGRLARCVTRSLDRRRVDHALMNSAEPSAATPQKAGFATKVNQYKTATTRILIRDLAEPASPGTGDIDRTTILLLVGQAPYGLSVGGLSRAQEIWTLDRELAEFIRVTTSATVLHLDLGAEQILYRERALLNEHMETHAAFLSALGDAIMARLDIEMKETRGHD